MLKEIEKPVVALSDKFRDLDPTDVSAVTMALSDGLSGTSQTVQAYEAALQIWFESDHAVAVSSGGAAISVALFAAGVRPGDEVVLPPTAPLCTIFPIIAAHASPVFCDVRADGLGMDLEDLGRVLTPRTRAVIEVPMWGYPTALVDLQDFARDAGVRLILDLAHSHGSRLHGRHLSAFGDISCFSTHERKPLATGEGGFILTDDSELAQLGRSYSRFGDLDGVHFGLNYKLGGLQAALGRSRLARLADQIASRQDNARALLGRLINPRVAELQVPPGGEPNYYALLLKLGFRDNAAFLRHLDAHGVPSDLLRYGGKQLYQTPAAAAYARQCPNAEKLFASLTTVPVHPGISGPQLEHIAKVVNDYARD